MDEQLPYSEVKKLHPLVRHKRKSPAGPGFSLEAKERQA
jgi:hypothetical protein